MSNPKINIIKADSFKEVYDAAPDELKDQIKKHATDYYAEKLGKLIASFNLKDATFIINAIRSALVFLECFSPDDFQLAYQMLPEDMLQVIKYAVQEEKNGSKD